ncbi:hypothetical protein Pssp01_31150 [Pseudomonas sp. NBRC 100443]|nr:hypothetical protein Pssp01_31150 [Pseudomonas sp. NBRC 100443]
MGQRSGPHPRIAPEPPAIAEKLRSYGKNTTHSRTGPARDFARRARSYKGMAQVGQRRSGSYPRSAPIHPAIAEKLRSYRPQGTAFRRSELAREPHGTALVREQARSYKSTSTKRSTACSNAAFISSTTASVWAKDRYNRP